MRLRPWVLTVPLLLTGCVIDPLTRRDLEGTFALAEGQTLRIEIPVGEVEIEATERPDVQVELRAGCYWRWRDCVRLVDELELASRSSTRRLIVELEGLDGWAQSLVGVEATIEMPRRTALEVDMGAGELEIRGVGGDTRVDLGAGELRFEMPAATVREAFVEVKIGQARLEVGREPIVGRRSDLMGRQIRWLEGEGEAEIDVEVGIGEASVRLESSPDQAD